VKAPASSFAAPVPKAPRTGTAIERNPSSNSSLLSSCPLAGTGSLSRIQTGLALLIVIRKAPSVCQ
jgi:hypothetical protein